MGRLQCRRQLIAPYPLLEAGQKSSNRDLVYVAAHYWPLTNLLGIDDVFRFHMNLDPLWMTTRVGGVIRTT